MYSHFLKLEFKFFMFYNMFFVNYAFSRPLSS